VIETARRTKDRGELERMERAADIADVALAVSLPFLHCEPTEAQFRDTLEAAMRQHGRMVPASTPSLRQAPMPRCRTTIQMARGSWRA